MTTYGVIGNGKLGRLLRERPNFIPIQGDITDIQSLRTNYVSVDVLVNCAGITSIADCETHPEKAIQVNVHGTHNLYEIYGDRVLTISSDHVFNGRGIFPPKETSPLSPINQYGWTKLGAEAIAQINGGKILRLSRVVDKNDDDMGAWILALTKSSPIKVPTFFRRNYLTRKQAVDGIEYMVKHYEEMPSVVHYGSVETVSMFDFMRKVALFLGIDHNLVVKQRWYDDTLPPRPLRGGFSTSLAEKLGFPMYYISDVVKNLVGG